MAWRPIAKARLHATPRNGARRGGAERRAAAIPAADDEFGPRRLVEGPEAGDGPVHLEPYREPGGRQVSDHPDNEGNGAMTPEALERILERVLENRERQRAAQGQGGR